MSYCPKCDPWPFLRVPVRKLSSFSTMICRFCNYEPRCDRKCGPCVPGLSCLLVGSNMPPTKFSPRKSSVPRPSGLCSEVEWSGWGVESTGQNSPPWGNLGRVTVKIAEICKEWTKFREITNRLFRTRHRTQGGGSSLQRHMVPSRGRISTAWRLLLAFFMGVLFVISRNFGPLFSFSMFFHNFAAWIAPLQGITRPKLRCISKRSSRKPCCAC